MSYVVIRHVQPEPPKKNRALGFVACFFLILVVAALSDESDKRKKAAPAADHTIPAPPSFVDGQPSNAPAYDPPRDEARPAPEFRQADHAPRAEP